MDPKGSLPHPQEPTIVPYTESQNAVHIVIISFIRSNLILSYNLCPISHMSSLSLAISCLKYL